MIGPTREDLAHEADDTCFTCFKERDCEDRCGCHEDYEEGD